MGSGASWRASGTREFQGVIWYNRASHTSSSTVALRGIDVNPHVHFSPVMLLASIASTVAVFGTLHLLALTNDNRASRAFISLGF